MTVFDVSLTGNKSYTEKMECVCKRVGDFMKMKFGLDEDDEFFDWTGVSTFSIFHNSGEYHFHNKAILQENSNSSLIEWKSIPWKDGEASMWWPQVDSPMKFPTGTCEFMLTEAKKLEVDTIVKFLIQEWNEANVGLTRGFGKPVRKVAFFKFLGNEFKASCTRRVP